MLSRESSMMESCFLSRESREVSESLSPDRRPPSRATSGRFNAEELTCFRRLPTPSAQIARKAEHWQSVGGLRRVLSDSSLHSLPPWRANPDDLGIGEQQSACALDTGSSAPRPYTPLEEKTAIVLDQIFPKKEGSAEASEPENRFLSRSRTFSDDGASRVSRVQSQSSSPVKKRAVYVPSAPSKTVLPANTRQERLLHLRRKLLDKFSNMKQAFDTFSRGPGDYEKELTRKQFLHFLGKFFPALGREEHDRIFELFDVDKSGGISLSELHVAIEASAPVRNIEDLRRRWIALGFTSMRQAIAAMDEHCQQYNGKKAVGFTTSRRLSFDEFVGALTRVGILDDKEHRTLFSILTNASDTSTVSLDELASGLASVSPSLLLEDLRDRLLKRYGSLSNAYKSLDHNANDQLDCKEFVQHWMTTTKLSAHEARKAFQLVDIDGSNWVSHSEFIAALRLSEPGLFLEEVRRKVRQRYRSIRQAFALDEQDVEKFGNIEMPQSPATSPTARRMTSPTARCMNLDDTPLVSKAFLHASVTYQDTEAKTLPEFCQILSQVQLTEADTQMLFELIDVNGHGKLTPLEFVRGLRLFAPSCVMEDLRLRCLARHACARQVFLEIGREFGGCSPAGTSPSRRKSAALAQASLEGMSPSRRKSVALLQEGTSPSRRKSVALSQASLEIGRRDVALDLKQFKKMLEDLDLSSGINAEAVFNLVENCREGGLQIGELVVALQTAAPGLQVPLPAGQRDAKARQQVRGQLAPFHRSALEFRVQVRQKLSEAEWEETDSSRWNMTDSKGFGRVSLSHSLFTKSAPSLQQVPEVPSVKVSWGASMSSSKLLEPLSPLSPPVNSVGWPVPQSTSVSPKKHQGPGQLEPLSGPSSPTKALRSRLSPKASLAHQATKKSHRKVTQLLQARPPSVFNKKEGEDPMLDRIHDYFASAGDKMASDMQLLKSPPKHLDHKAEKEKPRPPISVPTKS